MEIQQGIQAQALLRSIPPSQPHSRSPRCRIPEGHGIPGIAGTPGGAGPGFGGHSLVLHPEESKGGNPAAIPALPGTRSLRTPRERLKLLIKLGFQQLLINLGSPWVIRASQLIKAFPPWRIFSSAPFSLGGGFHPKLPPALRNKSPRPFLGSGIFPPPHLLFE